MVSVLCKPLTRRESSPHQSRRPSTATQRRPAIQLMPRLLQRCCLCYRFFLCSVNWSERSSYYGTGTMAGQVFQLVSRYHGRLWVLWRAHLRLRRGELRRSSQEARTTYDLTALRNQALGCESPMFNDMLRSVKLIEA